MLKNPNQSVDCLAENSGREQAHSQTSHGQVLRPRDIHAAPSRYVPRCRSSPLPFDSHRARTPNIETAPRQRDRALLAVLVTCALRRGELSRMNSDHLAMRDGRWVFLDFKGKGNKTRSVAVPLWVKQEIDGWLDTAGIQKGPIFRRVLANGRVTANQRAHGGESCV